MRATGRSSAWRGSEWCAAFAVSELPGGSAGRVLVSDAQAHAVRRMMVAGLAVSSALVAHAQAIGGLRLIALAPQSWGLLLMAAVLVGRRTAPFEARGAVRAIVVVLVAQIACHVAMEAVPWAFGLSAHSGAPVLTWAAVLSHGLAALALGLLLAWAERLLSSALDIARYLRRLLGARRTVSDRRAGPLGLSDSAPAAALIAASHPVRGPPLPSLS